MHVNTKGGSWSTGTGSTAARVALVMLACFGAPGCGGTTEIITIPPLEHPVVDIAVNDPYTLKVWLNEPAPEETVVSVEVSPAFRDSFELDTTSLVYAEGVQSRDLRVTGVATTGNDYAQFTFSVVDGDAQQFWRCRVNPQGNP